MFVLGREGFWVLVKENSKKKKGREKSVLRLITYFGTDKTSLRICLFISCMC